MKYTIGFFALSSLDVLGVAFCESTLAKAAFGILLLTCYLLGWVAFGAELELETEEEEKPSRNYSRN